MSENPVPGPFSKDEPREIRPPFQMFEVGKDQRANAEFGQKDFTPRNTINLDEEEEELVDPKDSPALESVESSTSETPKENESSASQEATADAEKDNTLPKVSVASSTPIF